MFIFNATPVKDKNKSSCMFVWLDIARCLYVKMLLLKDDNKSSCMFVWLDIANCLYLKLLLLKDGIRAVVCLFG